jgi:thiol-disulfide isomerase/thioredoxin
MVRRIGFAYIGIMMSFILKAQVQTVLLNEIGDTKIAEIYPHKVAMPVSKFKKKVLYTEIPNRFSKSFKDTIKFSYKTKSNRIVPKKIKCIDCKGKKWRFKYNGKQNIITITGNSYINKYHLFDLSEREGSLKAIPKQMPNNVLDTSQWLGVEMIYLKYGQVKVHDSLFSIGLFDANRDGKFTSDKDVITISDGNTRFFFVNFTCKSQHVVDIRYIDYYGTYFKINEIAENGSYIKLQEVTEPPKDSIIYIDNKIRNFKSEFNDSIYHMNNFLSKDKLLLIDFWTEFCPPCIRDIAYLNRLQSEYGDNITVLGIFDNGSEEDLNRIVNQYDIQYPVIMSSKEIKEDLTVLGFPRKLLVAPDGIILKRKISNKEIDAYLKERNEK